MSYLGFVPMMENFIKFTAKRTNSIVSILEIGVDEGQTALPLMSSLAQTDLEWQMTGVDIRNSTLFMQQVLMTRGLKPSVLSKTLDEKDKSGWNYHYAIENSLDFLPRLINFNKTKAPQDRFAYDLVLLDGDHNYQTVLKELELLSQLTHDYSLIVMDDYRGRYSNKDGYYADSEKHTGLDHKELERGGEKQGVKTAVKDFLAENSDWHLFDPAEVVPGEVACLVRKLEIGVETSSMYERLPTNQWREINLAHRWCQNWQFRFRNDADIESLERT